LGKKTSLTDFVVKTEEEIQERFEPRINYITNHNEKPRQRRNRALQRGDGMY